MVERLAQPGVTVFLGSSTRAADHLWFGGPWSLGYSASNMCRLASQAHKLVDNPSAGSRVPDPLFTGNIAKIISDLVSSGVAASVAMLLSRSGPGVRMVRRDVVSRVRPVGGPADPHLLLSLIHI